MRNEYNVEVVMERMGSKITRWAEDEKLDENLHSSRSILVKDRFVNMHSYLKMSLHFWFQDKNPDIELYNPMDLK